MAGILTVDEGGDLIINYMHAKNIRFSCAYLFRIHVNGKYFLVKDEQGRNTFQPVGGVYKYTDDSFFAKTHAIQCMRLGNSSDLDSDLRIIVPRNKAYRFIKWYRKEEGRECQTNLFREFREEVLDRLGNINQADFETIEYRYCGEHVEVSRMGENDLQIRIADVVELIPTPAQNRVFLELMQHSSSLYCFASKEDIYELGRTGGNQLQTISPHTVKILLEEEKHLKKNKHTGKYYKVENEFISSMEDEDTLPTIEKADISKKFTFVSYNSIDRKIVWNFCNNNTPPLENIWIDRKSVSENWLDDVHKVLKEPTCNKAILFVNKEYLLRSTACYEEAKLILDKEIPHIVILVNLDIDDIREIIHTWIHNDAADKNKLRLFKDIFHYDDDTGHINVSMYSLSGSDCEHALQSYCNL